MTKLLTLLSLLVIASCSTSLTTRGNSITVVDGPSGLASDCQRLGLVVGNSIPGWGNDVAVQQAFNDARNKAGELEGADTMVIASSNGWFTGGQVRAVVFNCNQQKVHLIRNISQQEVGSFEKAKLCQSKGGVWMNDKCVIDLD